jgi:hypothetical protein
MPRKSYAKICSELPGSCTVTATGGALTFTALSMAFSLIEDKDSVRTMIVRSMDVFGALKDRFDGKFIVWEPTRIDEACGYDPQGVEIWKMIMTPKRKFALRTISGMPENEVLLVSKKGKFAKVVVTK